MNKLKIAFIWLALVWLVFGLGLFANSFRNTLLFSAVAVGFSTPASVGLFAIQRIRSRGLSRNLGVFLVGIASVVAAVVPPMAMSGLREYHVGDAGMAVLFVMLLSGASAFAGFLILSLCISRALKRRPKPFPLLNKPRHRFKDVSHRNRHWKGNPRSYRSLN